MSTSLDALLGALIGLARASESKELSLDAGDALVDGLAMAFSSDRSCSGTSDSLEPSNQEILSMIDRLHKEKDHMAPDCAACQYPCGRTFDYDMEELYNASKALKSRKLELFSSLGQIALCRPLNAQNSTRQFLSNALFQISCTYEPEQLSEPLAHARQLLAQFL